MLLVLRRSATEQLLLMLADRAPWAENSPGKPAACFAQGHCCCQWLAASECAAQLLLRLPPSVCYVVTGLGLLLVVA